MEQNYAFRKALLQVHQQNRRSDSAQKADNEIEITEKWVICADTSLLRSAEDLQDYFFVSMGMKLSIVSESSSFAIRFVIDGSLKDNQYRLQITNEQIILSGNSCKTVARAGYLLEDLINLKEAPFVAIQDTLREMAFTPRMVHSGYGVDEFPLPHLCAMAHNGITAILVYVDGVNKCGGQDMDFQELAEQAELFGLDVYAYNHIRHRVYPEGAEAEKYYDDIYGGIFRAAPKLRGIVFVGESSEFPSKDTNTCGCLRLDNLDKNGNRIIDKPSPGWWPCYDYPLFINMIKKSIRAVTPDADIVFWSYNWGYVEEAPRVALLKALPTDISLLVTFEMFENLPVGETYTRIHDYSIYFEGPGQYFLSEAKIAKERNIRLYAMTNTGGRTWDIGVIPYVPTPYQWLKRYRAMLECQKLYGLCGTMDSHHYGWTPSYISDFAKWVFEEPNCDPEDILRKLAARDFSSEAVPTVLKAWQIFSDAIDTMPAVNKDQYGAFRVGPSYPLLLHKKDFVFDSPKEARSGGNRICFPMYEYNMDYEENKVKYDNEAAMQARSAELWLEGAKILESALPLVPARKLAMAQKEVGLAFFIHHCVVTQVNLRKWYALKQLLISSDKNTQKEIAKEMTAVAEAEMVNARRAIPYVQNDSRLGFEPMMHYMTDEAHILTKIQVTQQVIDEELSVYRN